MTRRRISTSADYKRSSKELQIHIAVAALLRLAADPRTIWYHPANEGERSVAAGAKLKAMGMLPGVADFALVLPGGQGAFLEIKTLDGDQSPEQRAFEALCVKAGVPYAVAHSLDEAKAILEGWQALRSNVRLMAA